MHLPSAHVMHAHGLCGEYSVRTLFESLQICPADVTPYIDGDTIHVNYVVNFWMGGMDQRIFHLSAAAPLGEPKRQHLTEALWVSGQYDPEDTAH